MPDVPPWKLPNHHTKATAELACRPPVGTLESPLKLADSLPESFPPMRDCDRISIDYANAGEWSRNHKTVPGT